MMTCALESLTSSDAPLESDASLRGANEEPRPMPVVDEHCTQPPNTDSASPLAKIPSRLLALGDKSVPLQCRSPGPCCENRSIWCARALALVRVALSLHHNLNLLVVRAGE